MNSYEVITVSQIHPLRVSANSKEEAYLLLTEDAFRGGYQIPSDQILAIELVAK